MKTVNLILPVLVAVAVLSACNNQQSTTETTTETTPTVESVNYTVNADSSSFVMWKGVMLGVKEHFGKVFFKEGSLSVAGGQLTGGTFTVDLTNIVPLDAAYDEKKGAGKDKLVGHLSSADFFDTANHPTASFKIDSVSGGVATGTFTVRGKSNTETLTNITISESGSELKATGQLVFDRKKYDVAFDMPMKDMVISNDITLNIELTAKR